MKTARWHKNAPTTWILKARAQDGGAVLATINGGRTGYTWTAGPACGSHRSLYGAQRAARKALREAAK